MLCESSQMSNEREDGMLEITCQRTARRWSRAELGRRARIHPARIGQAELGHAILYPVELRRLARALKYEGDPGELLQPATDEADVVDDHTTRGETP